MRKKEHIQNKQLMVLTGYRKDQWETLLATAADADELYHTWGEWNEQGQKNVATLKARGIPYIWVTLDVEECHRHFKERGIPNTGESRVCFAMQQHEAKKHSN
jgi:hypothetical protein